MVSKIEAKLANFTLLAPAKIRGGTWKMLKGMIYTAEPVYKFDGLLVRRLD